MDLMWTAAFLLQLLYLPHAANVYTVRIALLLSLGWLSLQRSCVEPFGLGSYEECAPVWYYVSLSSVQWCFCFLILL